VDGLQHAIGIVKHIIIREAQNIIALRGQRGRANSVASNLLLCRVSCAIDFDDNPRFEAGEVGDKVAENNLTTESEARDLFAPEALPQAALLALRLRLRAKALNPSGMARPPTLARPHRGAGTYSTVTCVFTELAMKQISWAW
jgi:hypothetical protein